MQQVQLGGFFSPFSKKEVASTSEIKIIEDTLMHEELPTEFTETKGSSSKPKIAWQFGDSRLSLAGKAKQEYTFANNSVMLNGDIPDQVGFFKTTLELSPSFAWGKQKYGHDAVETKVTLRHKSLWGQGGATTITDNIPVNVSQTLTKPHSHKSVMPLMWVKEAWIKLSLGALLGCQSENLHSLQLGMFGFSLGRGISFGDGYGTPKGYLGVYDRVNDFMAPGILFSGSIIKDRIEYDLYYSKRVENSAKLSDTFNQEKYQQIGHKLSPWRGKGKDDDLWAAQFKFLALNEANDNQELKFQPYILYNDAQDKKVEFPGDSRMRLGIAGLGIDYKNSGFEAGCEAALNFGRQDVYAWDRNQNQLKRDDSTGNIQELYTKVVNASNGTPAFVSDDRDNRLWATDSQVVVAATNNQSTGSDTAVITDKNGTPLYSANDRFRQAYKNTLKGWMAVADMSYHFESINLKIATAGGYASGDKNPHDQESDGSYRGFIGLDELYMAGKVTSIMMLCERDIMRPQSIVEGALNGSNTIETDSSFTDIAYVGGGLTWNPTIRSHKLTVNPNVLGFWKASSSLKYDAANGVVLPNTSANKYLGTEFNMIAELELLQDLKLLGKIAFFLPGGYYTDIKGVPLAGDFTKDYAIDGATQVKYRLSNDGALYLNVGLEYKF